MKNIKITITLLTLCISCSVFAQLRSYNTISDQTQNSSAFFDASSSPLSLPANTDLGKGLIFPRTDLTQFGFTPVSSSFFETGYDGMIVYNTGTGTTPNDGTSGIGNQDVTSGFYYFSNPSSTGNSATGQWIPMDTDTRGETIITTNTINESVTIINGTPEKVVLLDGVANGTTTELVLDNTVLDPGTTTVNKLREAKVYDSSNNLLLIASGNIRVDSGSYVIVSGDGMVNKLLPSDTYSVELYFE